MRGIAWTKAQNAVVLEHYMLSAAELQALVNAAGPPRTSDACVARRSALGVLKKPRPAGGRASLRRMISDLAQANGVTVDQLRGQSRRKRIVKVRQAIMASAYSTGRWSLLTVGDALARDHTTVLHAVKKLRALAEREAA